MNDSYRWVPFWCRPEWQERMRRKELRESKRMQLQGTAKPELKLICKEHIGSIEIRFYERDNGKSNFFSRILCKMLRW